jgi:hypothetical protein
MADKKISQLNAATTIFDADDFAVVQDGETKQTNASVVKTYVKAGFTKADAGLGNVDNTSDATKNSATATLTNKTISGSSNTLSNIGNSSLTNSAITFGATSQALGSTVSALNAVSIGGTTAAAGAFTTLSASSTVSGTGFSTYLASPPAIGGTTPAAGTFTNLAYTGTLTGGTGVIAIGTNQIYKDASGNLGLGVTPTNASTTIRTFELASNSSRTGNGITQQAANSFIQLNSNTKYDASGNALYAQTVPAATYDQFNGAHRWSTAPYGTAGSAISFTQAMTLTAAGVFQLGSAISLDPTTANALVVNSSGDVGIGTASPLGKLDISYAGNSTNAYTMVIGAGENTTNRPNATHKLARIASVHYTNAQKPFGVILTSSNSTDNTITFGGGTGSFTAATSIGFVTAANNTTNIGTARFAVKPNGQVRFVPLSADPSGAETGDVYYNSSINKLKVRTSAGWETITSAL